MSTKVKGDKIKEGSIPMSALDNTITEAIPYVKYNAEPIVINIKKGVIEYNLGRYVDFGEYFKFNNITHPAKDSHNFDANLTGPTITGNIENRETGYLVLSSAPIVDQTVLLYPHVYLSKIKKEFLPDDIGGADWNAQQGEAGYIENKPFYKIATANKYSCIFINFDGSLEISPSEKIYADNGNGFGYGRVANLYFFDGIMHHHNEKIPVIRTGKPIQFVCYDKNNLTEKRYTLSFPDMYKGQFSLILTPHHYEIPDEFVGYYLTVKIENYNAINYGRTFTFGPEYVLDQQKLDISNIESALSYAPQTLFNNEKNQALVNLGIADLLEALKPVRLSGEPPVGNVTQEQLDEIGLTEKVINNILNGYTNRIYIDNKVYCVTDVSSGLTDTEFTFAKFQFEADGTLNALMQYTYFKNSDVTFIELKEI